MSGSGRLVHRVGLGLFVFVLAFGGLSPDSRLWPRPEFALLPSVVAQGPSNYTYTVIADVTNCFNIGSPVLNNDGEAAFAAQCFAPIGTGSTVVRRGDGSGGPLAEIYTFVSGFSVPEPVISINDHGAVAFPGFNGGARSAILVGDGGPVTAVVDTELHTQFKGVLRPSINNAGAVAFMAQTTTNGYDSVVVASGGSFATIAGPGTVSPSIGTFTAAIEAVMNDDGLVAYLGQSLTSNGIFTSKVGPSTVTLNNPSTFNGINAVGRVAFVSNSSAVQVGDGGPVRTIATTGSTFVAFPGGGAAINDASLVAFMAQLTSGPIGVFIGPNPATDTVIKIGDVIPGLGTVIGAGAGEEAINNRGQVALAVAYDSGSGGVGRAILRADPIRAATMTSLGVSPNPGVLGQPVTLTATVTATSGVASGQVEFFNGATSLGTATPTNGVATLQTSALALGSHRLLVAFAGSTGFLPSLSPAVPITIDPPPPLQAPINLEAASIVGNVVTLRWTIPSIGPTPTNFALEGGLNPGEVLASIPTNSPFPIFTISAPTGAFYVRIHALTGTERSGPSNEIRIFVNTATPPSAPSNLLGLVNGSSMGLSWRNTFAGGTPTAVVIDVTGAQTASLPVGLTESFTFNAMPAGTYTFSVRATNAAGTSTASNPVTLTFPGGCSGVPNTPSGFLAYRIGNVISIVWNPAATGPAPSSYVVNVSGSFVGSFPTSARTLSGSAGPGAYGFSVVAAHACGSSAPTAVQTVTIP